MDEIAEATWGAPLKGTNLTGSTLAEQIGERPTALVFARHLG